MPEISESDNVLATAVVNGRVCETGLYGGSSKQLWQRLLSHRKLIHGIGNKSAQGVGYHYDFARRHSVVSTFFPLCRLPSERPSKEAHITANRGIVQSVSQHCQGSDSDSRVSSASSVKVDSRGADTCAWPPGLSTVRTQTRLESPSRRVRHPTRTHRPRLCRLWQKELPTCFSLKQEISSVNASAPYTTFARNRRPPIGSVAAHVFDVIGSASQLGWTSRAGTQLAVSGMHETCYSPSKAGTNQRSRPRKKRSSWVDVLGAVPKNGGTRVGIYRRCAACRGSINRNHRELPAQYWPSRERFFKMAHLS